MDDRAEGALLRWRIIRPDLSARQEVRLRADPIGRIMTILLLAGSPPIAHHDQFHGKVIGYEGFARSYSETEQGLCL